MNQTKTWRQGFATRIRQIRVDHFGEGEPALMKLTDSLGIPARTWKNYEDGVNMPAEIVLKLIELTGVDPRWLLTGEDEADSLPDFD